MKVSELVQELKLIYPKHQPSTFAFWDKSVKPIADLPVDSINKATVRRVRAQMLTDLSENTVIARLGYLKGLWRKGLRWELIEGNNIWEYSDDGLKKTPRDPEFKPWEFWEPYHEHPWFRFLWYTGARIAEIAGLDPANIVMDVPIPYFNFVHQSNRRLKNDASIRKGDLLVVIGALFWSLHIIFIGELVNKFDLPVTVGLVQTFVVSVFSILIGFYFETFTIEKILMEKYEILYAGILSGGFAFVLQIYAQKNISPAPAAIIYSLEGVFATIAAWIILSQILNFNNILGCLFILAGVLISQLIPEIRKFNYK